MVSRTLVAALLVTSSALAREPRMDAATLAHALDRLAFTGRVLYVAAHPDDENTRLLAHLANERHLGAAYLSMTRGGGGQNLIGTEQGELLDVIRTEELLAARALDGAVQRFSRMRDFGYSKSADETFRTWNRDEALADVVWVVRTFQPDVIVTRFDEQPPNHGHHTASAILAREAFAAAADPQRFPGQLAQGATAWQASRLVHNVSPWKEGPPPKDAIVLDVGGYDARRGLASGELAAHSRSQHKSQGFGVQGERGPLLERFTWIAGAPLAGGILDGVELGWKRYGPQAEPYAKAIDEARAALGRDHPEEAIPALVRADAALDALPLDPRTRDAREALSRVIAGAAGLFVRATAARPVATPGSMVKVDLEVVKRLPSGLALRRIEWPGATAEIADALAPNEKRLFSKEIEIPGAAPITTPHWLAEPPEPGRFVVSDHSLRAEPRGRPALQIRLAFAIEGRELKLVAPVVHAWTDRVHGERVRDFVIVPPATVTPAREAVLVPNGKPAPVVLRIRAGRDAVKGDVKLGLPAGWRSVPASLAVELPKAGDEVTVRFDVSAPTKAGPVTIAPAIELDDRAWSFREDVIDHPHLPLQLVLQPASLRLAPIEIKLPAGPIGYVPGPGDTVAEDLAHVGLKVETIDDETLRSGDLDRFRAIVVGIRAYNARAVVKASNARLLRFVEGGGTVVVQYQTNSRIAPLEIPIGPFPLEIGRDRVTDEGARLEPVSAKQRVLAFPNALVDGDYEGWVQERGIYFASKWDARYEPIFRVADPGEKPLEGSTLVAKHGKGRWVYTGLAFFRQLPAGVPGAYRLFVNLLAR